MANFMWTILFYTFLGIVASLVPIVIFIIYLDMYRVCQKSDTLLMFYSSSFRCGLQGAWFV